MSDQRPVVLVVLDGWGYQDTHETLNAFIWGPDGWLYGCHGVFTHSKVGKPGTADDQRTPLNAGVWRYHPVRHEFEVYAHGTSNPWGLDYDQNGEFFVTACVIPHLWHVIPGGIYHRQGGRHINPYVYSDIKTIADHRHRSAHGGARIYLADEFPKDYRGRIFMANIHEHSVLSDVLEPIGSGFVARHGDDVLMAMDDGRTIRLPSMRLDTWDLAYACTVHKAQGSSVPIAVVPVLGEHRHMLTRNLLYTAVTRAERACVMVGDRGAVMQALQRVDGATRFTALPRRIRAALANAAS